MLIQVPSSPQWIKPNDLRSFFGRIHSTRVWWKPNLPSLALGHQYDLGLVLDIKVLDISRSDPLIKYLCFIFFPQKLFPFSGLQRGCWSLSHPHSSKAGYIPGRVANSSQGPLWGLKFGTLLKGTSTVLWKVSWHLPCKQNICPISVRHSGLIPLLLNPATFRLSYPIKDFIIFNYFFNTQQLSFECVHSKNLFF